MHIWASILSSPPPCGFRALNSGPWAWWQAPLPVKPYLQLSEMLEARVLCGTGVVAWPLRGYVARQLSPQLPRSGASVPTVASLH